MFKYLENLRNKPEPERRKSVLLISLSLTFIIIIMWGITLALRVEHTDFSFDPTLDKKMPSLRDTFSNFIDRIGSVMDNDAKYASTTETSTDTETAR